MTNTGRVFSRWMRKPVTGMTTAMVNMNAVVNHCPVRASTPRSSMIGRNATLMVVSLRKTTNVAATMSQTTRKLGGAIGAASRPATIGAAWSWSRRTLSRCSDGNGLRP